MKKINRILIAMSLLFLIPTQVYAEENCTFYPAISNICELEMGPVLKLNGKNNNTYWQFKNTEEAVYDIYNVEAELINRLKKSYNLGEFTFSNWEDYKTALDYEIYSNSLIEDDHTERLNTFFDVCDNQTRNREIVDLYNSDDYTMEELAVLMPYTSPYYIDYCNITRIESRAAFNVNNAVSYATKYAYSYNYSYEVFLNGDCTNFASQIARAGGISNKSGWYYHGVNNSSKSWRVADTFVKYWKVSYSTTSFNTLSKKVAKGNFIAYDSNSDGKWNHVAFVTDTRSGTTSAGYRDLRIAQHTKNYNAWVSSETNGWENVSGLKAIVVTPN